MSNISQTDINVYLQLIGIEFSTLGLTFSNDLRYGRNCTIKDRENLLLLSVYLDILKCYNVLGGSVTEDDNCFTEEEIQNIIGKISKLSGINFQAPGYSYTPA